MNRGLYVAASGMLVQQQRQDVIANNLANVNTSGFKRQRSSVQSFARELDAQFAGAKPGSPSILDMPNSVVLKSNVVSDAASGLLQQTGNPSDLALTGTKSHFTVMTPDGVAYTRNGTFKLDSDGRLVNSEGYPVMGQRGAITIEGNNWNVTALGEVEVDGEVIDSLNVMDITDLSTAQRLGNNLWKTDAATSTENPGVQQGYLEGSNVNAVEEMISMITALRSYEASQRAIQSTDATLERAVNDIARP